VLALIAGVNGAIAGTLIFKGGAMMLQLTHLDLDVAPAGAIQQGWTYSYSCWRLLQKM
jgi:hypothetical protein